MRLFQPLDYIPKIIYARPSTPGALDYLGGGYHQDSVAHGFW